MEPPHLPRGFHERVPVDLHRLCRSARSLMAVTGPRAFIMSSKPDGNRRGGGGGVGALSCASPNVAARIAHPGRCLFSRVDAVSADIVKTFNLFG